MFLRTELLICIAVVSGTAVSQDKPAGRAQEPNRLVTRTYPVADLVLPIPGLGIVVLGGSVPVAPLSDLRTPDFEPLIAEITTIEPATWEAASGPGSVTTRASELALVVTQTEAVHDEVANLIRRRRRELDNQVSVEVRRVGVSETFFEAAGKDVSRGGERRIYDESGAASLMQAVQSEGSSFDPAPRITLFDGQTAWISQAAGDKGPSLGLNATISDDRRVVRLSVAASGTRNDDIAILRQNIRVPDRQTLLVDCGPPAKGERRELLLITPRVILVDEEGE